MGVALGREFIAVGVMRHGEWVWGGAHWTWETAGYPMTMSLGSIILYSGIYQREHLGFSVTKTSNCHTNYFYNNKCKNH